MSVSSLDGWSDGHSWGFPTASPASLTSLDPSVSMIATDTPSSKPTNLGSTRLTTDPSSASTTLASTASSTSPSGPAQTSRPHTAVPTATSASSTKDGLRVPLVIGLGIGASVFTICVMAAVYLFAVRRKRRSALAIAEPFVARHDSWRLGSSARPPSSDSLASAVIQGKVVDIRASIGSRTSSSMMPQVSDVDTAIESDDARRSPPRKAYTAPVHLLGPRRHLRSTPRDVSVQESHPNQTIEDNRAVRYEADGGVRLAGGRPSEEIRDNGLDTGLDSGRTLPPPYSSHFVQNRAIS
ncbi:hypothetical protein BD309DRAFT_961087 [Dichomitus squalens]|nr:hypothetical protein BD309DRAFT_961087 [Dichomitus squalens]